MVVQRAKQTFTVNKAEMGTSVQIPPKYVFIAIPNRDTAKVYLFYSKIKGE